MIKQVIRHSWILVLLIVFTVVDIWNTYMTNFGQTNPFSWQEYVFSFILAVAAWLAATISFRYCNRQLARWGNTLVSIMAFFSGALLFYVFYMLYHGILIHFLIHGKLAAPWRFWNNGLFMLMSIYLPIAVFCLLLMHQRRLSALQQALLEKEKVNQQKELQFINRQLDHHFLFNNFHFLANLAEKNDGRTVAFTQKMAMLYRYVTRYAKEEVVSLQEEIQFARDYLDIMEYRFPGQFRMEWAQHTNMPLTALYIMPGALQLLVENVIKHNEVPEGASLLIQLHISDDQLTVTNAVHPKLYRHESLGVGLRQLSEFYNLRWNKQLLIRREQQQFTVTLPLIQSAA
ncbi:histidine kinase [Chitinophaga agrisoli]|uniref:Histidine kinase n=1 Tax=Chitinophaga agrisoli TaxID=2607653 RepID=A0A5B2W253_9BACT|nr:sensor histidine kinase [Chitinophaga agrisoli]KAA2245721.1 histidine kinase [Chitinophaga agrisoli]